MVDLPAFPVRFVSLPISSPCIHLYLFVAVCYFRMHVIINQGNIEEVSYVHEIVPVAVFSVFLLTIIILNIIPFS